MATLGVQIVGDAVGLKTALAEATAATEKYAATSKAAFGAVSDASLQAQIAQYNLGKAADKYGAGSVGAAKATLAYRRQVDALKASHLATAQSIGRGLSTYVTAPTALLGYESVKMGIEFQRQMLLIQTQAGASAKEVQNLTGQVLKLAPAVGMGPTELAQGLYHLESLGLRGGKALNTLHISAIAAGMGIANLEDVTTALGGAVVTGIKGAENYQAAMATLTATVGAGNMRFEDLAGSIGSVAPAAAAAGITLPELGAAMATLTDRGFSADEAATRLRMTFALIQSPTDKARNALKDMGVDADSLGGILRSPNGLLKVLDTLHAAVDRVGKTRGNRDLLAGFGGGRSGLGIQTLVGSLDQPLSSYQKKLEDVSAGERKYAANQKAYMESSAFKLAQDWAEAKARLTQFGSEIAPVAVKAVQAVGVMGDAFAKLPRSIQTEIGVVVGLFAVGGPLILGLVAAKKMVGTLGAAFRMLPLEAGPAVAATDAELATLGGSAQRAEARVAGLRGSLLGLAGKVFTVGLLLDLIPKADNKNVPGFVQTLDNTPVIGGAISQGVRIGSALHNAIFGGAGGNTDKGFTGGLNAFGKGGSLNPTSLLENTPRASGLAGVGTHRHGSGGSSGGGALKPIDTFALPFALQVEQARAQLTKGTADDAKSLRDVVAYAKKQIDSGRLTHKAFLAALTEEGAALGQLYGMQASQAKKATKKAQQVGQFSVPLELQVAQARADALAALHPNASGPTSLQLKLAHEVESRAMKAIKGNKLSMEGLRDAWGIVGQANGVIGQSLGKTAKQVAKESSMQFIRGLHFASEADKQAAEARFAQVQAHNGTVPRGVAANGIVIHVHGVHDPDQVAKKVVKHIQQAQKRAPRQTRGRHGGNPLAIG